MPHLAAVLPFRGLEGPAGLVAAVVEAASLVLSCQVADLWILVGSGQGILICLKVGLWIELILVNEVVRFPCGLCLILVLQYGLGLLECIGINVDINNCIASLSQYLMMSSGSLRALRSWLLNHLPILA